MTVILVCASTFAAAVGHAAEAHAAAAAGHATLGMLANAHVALTAEVEAHRTATLQASAGHPSVSGGHAAPA